MFQRPSINSLSVPNLLDHYPQESDIRANKAMSNHGYSSNSTIPEDTNENRTTTMNINELSFTTYRNQEAVRIKVVIYSKSEIQLKIMKLLRYNFGCIELL